ncbi:MAG: inorganic diphosphatase, partial [Myxococcales bacterium]|nr:inorganic diphosphatase [Myxococcales bacterium]
LGVMRMRDDKGVDDKIIAVSARDPAFAGYQSLEDLPVHTTREIKRFFEDYKALENKRVDVEEPLGREEALVVLRASLLAYRKLRRSQGPR